VDIMSSIITDASKAAFTGTDRGLQEDLDFHVAQERLSATFPISYGKQGGGVGRHYEHRVTRVDP
jgi:hypothetical protein